jgi:hypothetical protein
VSGAVPDGPHSDGHAGLELSRVIKLEAVPDAPLHITASDKECAALAGRFGLDAIEHLIAEVTLERDGETILAAGKLTAKVQQICAISGEAFANTIEDQIGLRFCPKRSASGTPDEEIELGESDLDQIDFTGKAFDLGEAIAQSLGLAIDPYAEGPGAEDARKSGLVSSAEASGPFAMLAELKKD